MLGIIGGNGVAATNRLNILIEEKITKAGAYRDGHHPEIIIWQATKAPSRSMYLEGRGPSWIEEYVEIGKKLKLCGCMELCMCCNTAHYAIDELSEKIGLPFINLLDLVAHRCDKMEVKRIGVLCTDGLKKVGLYEKRFNRIAPEIEIVFPDDGYQQLVTTGICNAKNSVRFKNPEFEPFHPHNCFGKVCQHLYEDKKVDCIVGGCTDISNVFTPSYTDFLYIDSLDVLADYIATEHLASIEIR